MLATVDAAPRKSRGLWPVAAALVLAAGAGFFGARALSSSAPAQPITFTPRTFDPQIIWAARFVGDDGTIVFSSSPLGLRPDLFVARAGAPAAQQIGPPGTHLLSVSSRGELAVLTDASFINQRVFRGTLARMTLDGSPRPWLENVEAEWSPDGMTLAAIRVTDSEDLLEYSVGTILHRSPGYLSDLRVSPDGSQVAFFEHPVRYDDRSFVKIWERGGSVRVLAGEYWGMQGLAWRPDGQSVYFSAGAGVNVLYQIHEVATSPGSIARPGGPPTPLTPEGFTQPGPFSPDGSVMVVQAPDGTGHLLSLKDGALRRFDGLTGKDAVFAWTSDGRGLFVGAAVDMRLDRLDLTTGKRTPALQFELAGQPGIKGGGTGVSITPDGRGYAYYYISMPSRLFEISGAGTITP